DGAKRVKHLPRLRRQHAVPAHLGQRVRVDLAVLPDLELSKMKAERLDLPDEVLQLAVRLSRRARAGERGLDAAEVCQEIGSRRIAAASIARPGRAQPVGDMKKDLAVLLRGRALFELRPSLGVGGTKRRQPAFQVGSRWGGGGIGGQGAAD